MRAYVIFLINLLLLQNMQISVMCRRPVPSKRHSLKADEDAFASSSALKRTISGGGAGQSEELLQRPGNQMESNYDEYPMVVPKRAALLIDRLMAALHHALEKGNNGHQRFNELYLNSKNGAKQQHEQPDMPLEKPNNNNDFEQDGSNYNMYSDDDPSVLMDYDFKDLNSINRATGESLMAKSFQRRAQGLEMGSSGVGDNISAVGMARLMAAAANDDGTNGGVSVGGAARNSVGNSGRLYWRCYFNAVSCF